MGNLWFDNTPFKNVNLTVTAVNGDVSHIAKLGENIQFYATNAGTGSVTATIEYANCTIQFTIKYNPNLTVGYQKVSYTNNTVLTINYNTTATGNVNITLKGKKYNYTFEKELNETISLGNILPDEYNVTVTYSGRGEFANASANGTLKVNNDNSTNDVGNTVNKATPKIIAKKKTFRAKTKIKKYTITLKDNTGKPIKKAKVTISLKKITKKKSKKKKTKTKSKKKKKKSNTAITNAKGKATFKIDRTKKGKYWATIKYKGNKYYKAVSKKAKITLK